MPRRARYRQDQSTTMAKHVRVTPPATRRVRAARRAALVAAVAIPVGWLAMSPASAAIVKADSDQRVASVADVAEAWYASSPIDICTTPLGCPPAQVPSSPYPAHTLHVGVAGGQETARTYVLPNLVSLPYGAKFLSGTMTLPVTTDNSAGTVSPEAAKIQACLTKAPIADGTEGSTQTPPAVDCSTKAALKYDAKKAVFTLDLTPFLTAWSGGRPALGIALLPASAGPTDSWHVSFNGRKYAGSHIASSVVFTPPPPTSTGSGTQTSVPPPVAPPSAQPAPQSPPNISLPPQTTGTTPAAPPQVATPTVPAPVAQPVAVSREFQYPLAFLFPIVLLGAAVFFIRLFTRDPLPVRPVR
jgi:hypothetical protein